MRLARTLLLAAPLACAGGSSTAGSDTDTGTVSITGSPTPPPGTGSTAGTGGSESGSGGAVDSTGTSAALPTSTGPDDTTAAPTSTGPDTTTGDATTQDGATATTEPVEACPCPDLEVPLDDGIFVLAKTAELWKFLPATSEFQLLGALDCGLPASTFSMGVDRAGYAWVQFSGGELRTVDVTDPSQCGDPGFIVGQQGIGNFGMAFVSNSEDDACDRIYGNHYNGMPEGNDVSEFFSVDPATLEVVPVGMSDYGLAELTGTGDGRAFLFADGNPVKLVEVDKQSGDTLAVLPLPGVDIGSGFAFAFFAGDFYFFTDSEGDSQSEVTRLDYDDSDNDGQQELEVVVADAPIRIVGAGVSTCAPVIPQ